MRKFAAILLLTSFLTAQYARQLSYVECTVTNYFASPANRCDCEKIIVVDKKNAASSPAPITHNHAHIEEAYCPSRIISKEFSPQQSSTIYPSAPATLIADGIADAIDHPPQDSPFCC